MKGITIVFLILIFHFSYSFAEEKEHKYTDTQFFANYLSIKSTMFPDEESPYLKLIKLDSEAAQYIGLYWIVKAKKECTDFLRYSDQFYDDACSALLKYADTEKYSKMEPFFKNMRDSEKGMCVEGYIYDNWDAINKMFSSKLDEVKKKKVDDKP